MWRFRFFNFFIDSTRNHPDPKYVRDLVREKYGAYGLEQKITRYLECKPPVLTTVEEYRFLYNDVVSAYISGSYFSALTGAVVLGERILNQLLLRLRDHYKASPFYKSIYDKDSCDDWERILEIFESWDAIPQVAIKKFHELKELRRKAVHYGIKSIPEIEKASSEATALISQIIGDIFGVWGNKELLFFDDGEVYIKREKEGLPLVKEFFVPCCRLVSYKHSVEGAGVLVDDNSVPNTVGEDAEFIRLRNSYHKSKEF